MPDIPLAAFGPAVKAIAAVQAEALSDGSCIPASNFALANAALDAAAPILAGEIAQRILAHMEEHCPPPAVIIGDDGETVDRLAANRWRRHFGIAARIAAGAFTTEDEMKQMAAEALAAASESEADADE